MNNKSRKKRVVAYLRVNDPSKLSTVDLQANSYSLTNFLNEYRTNRNSVVRSTLK
nr:hypothetical protein [Paenibacillus bovis]